jgi:geranylgeranyl diphosphate synthase type II
VNVERYLAERRAMVEAALERALPPAPGEGVPPRLHEAMRYAVFSGGKRVRPVLSLMACEAAGGVAERALPFACALELIHTYSLVHDDLPAMDDDELRRGRPTVHVAFDEALAILAGDALLTEAFRLVAEGALAADLEPARALGVVAAIAVAAGASGMVGGQVADLEAEGVVADEALVASIHRRKTAALIAAAIAAGAVAGGAADADLRALNAYGQALGLAFQVADDLLDATASTSVTGKREGGDAAHGKATYPAVLGLDGARRVARALLTRCLDAVAPLGERAEPLRALATFIVERAAGR